MSTMVERSDIPKDIMEQAQSVAAHLYAYGSSSYDFASNIIGRALHAERLAAEKRGKEEAAKIIEDELVAIYEDSPDIDIECNNLVRRVLAAIRGS